MESVRTRILYNDRVAPGYYRLGLAWKTPSIVPGHFVMLRVEHGLDPLLRRPFGIYRVLGARGRRKLRGSGIEILYQVVGKGTSILSMKAPGETIDLLGPLGGGFPAPAPGRRVILAAGGMGIAPLYLLARTLKGGVLLFGARDRTVARIAREFKSFDCKVRIATDDGSAGRKGFVTELLGEEVTEDSVVYACGPVAMLKASAAIAQKAGALCHVSLERSMACGIGVCLGCAVRMKVRNEEENKNYRMVCSEGPVFDSRDIDWDVL
ncbi:MAG: dihydroorotate dehydrogenase electron transfer subunit [Thermodesulfobacteriota bacterium]